MVSKVTTIQKARVERTWADIEPKVYAAFASGLVASLILIALHYAGVPLNPAELVGIPYLASVVAAYLKASTHKGGLTEELQEHGLQQLQAIEGYVKDAVPAAAPFVDDVERVQELLAATPELSITLPSTVVADAAAEAASVSTGTLQVTSA